VSGSWALPGETIANNVLAQRNLFEAILASGVSPLVLIASSAEAYGKVPLDELPASEGRILRPVSPYGMSKVAQETLAERYRRSNGLKVVVTRGFNQSGPGQEAKFVVSDFARQTALIEAGKQEPVISTGNVEARRDFTDVRDVAEAYRLAAEKGASGDVYNICSGEAHAVRDILNAYRRMAKKSFEVREDRARFRPSDVPVMVGDARKLRERTGWKPGIPFERMLEDTLDYWRKQIA
jgi:GDP-4-dehydro-6-deoxy-D-mannose reductase